jgi:ferredoxin-NADP reductase
MDREAGIEAYQAMITAQEYQARLGAGDDSRVHRYRAAGESPVLRLEVTKSERLCDDVMLYELAAPDRTPLPEWTAGAHLDIVVAPEYLRQYSMSGDPADRTTYQIGVLREDAGRGGSKLMHRIFTPGRKVFVSRPINHFPLDETAAKSFLMGGGIGITPMIAFAHRLHALGADFELHYSARSRRTAGYAEQLAAAPFADRVHLHLTDEGRRADLDALLAGHKPGWHVYTCGPDRYMRAVADAATARGFPEEAQHLEYFSVPELPPYENVPFTLKLARSGREIAVPADRTAADVLNENGIPIDVKCSDGICGVCKCGLVSGTVEHRDFVLSKKQRQTSVILCQSRAAEAGGMVVVDL